MPTIALLRRVTSTRYIFLLSGLAFVLWSLAASVVPKSSALSALFQLGLGSDETPAMQPLTNVGQGDTSAPSILNTHLGSAHTRLFVISLASRHDRREQMEFLRTAQDLTWTVVDAIPGNATLVGRILDWVTHQRAEGKKTGASGFRWPEEINALSASRTPLNRSGSDTWTESPLPSKSKHGKSRPSATSSPRLACAIEDDSIPTFANDTPDWMVLSPAKIACWHSHVSAIRQFVDGQDAHGHHSEDDVAFIFEDDIDMEKDISTRLSQVWTFLPAGWDMVFLGHCWSDESHYPPLTAFPDTNLHPSHSPKCTHAYALSLSGARQLLQHLRHPPFAYSRALDQAYAWLVRSGRLRGYSIVPSLVVQQKRARSDISPGSGSEWREHLRDGVLDA